jgi:hypothetical protein
MKCPGCGKELGTDPLCSKCGFNHTGKKDEIEVEYKDFKTSELLEIRQKRQATPPGNETITERKLKAQVSDKANRTSSFPVSAVIALILMLISCLFILFRYLVKR